MFIHAAAVLLTAGLAAAVPAPVIQIQSPPAPSERSAYRGLLAAVSANDLAGAEKLIRGGANVNQRDPSGRTPLMIAAFNRNHQMARRLIAAGADVNAREHQRYDVLTISSVLDDVEMIGIVLRAGADAGLITSPYDGTALIAAAHLGRVEVVRALIRAKAPLDHVNNLGWTALIEAIVLGDGGERHQAVVKDLIDAGADVNLADGNGVTPLALARGRGYPEMERLLENAGARP